MPFELFDRSKLLIKPLCERVSDIDLSVIMDPSDDITMIDDDTYDTLAESIYSAKKKGAAIILMYGAHVIRSGCSKYMIKLMKEKLITHFATNGAGAIHDFELAYHGQTCESVAKYISNGQFGLWKETAYINNALKNGVMQNLGAGEAIGKYIIDNNFKYSDCSVLAAAYKYGIPATVHIGVGNDIIHQHPNADGAIIGQASYTDFLIYTNSISKLENGVFLNFGSAVTGPEVYLKALAMARNVAHQKGIQISNITTAVFDLLPIENEDYSVAPPKTDPRYYFRPWKTILSRTVADGGRSFYLQGTHEETLPNLAKRLFEMNKGE